MPFTTDERIDAIRSQHRQTLERPIHFVASPQANELSQAYQQKQRDYKEAIDSLMESDTIIKKLTRHIAAIGGAYLVYKAGTKQSTQKGWSLNPINLLTQALGSVFNSLASTPKAMLSMAMAGATFDAIHQALGQAEGGRYFQQLKEKIERNPQLSQQIKCTFERLSEEMLRAFCLRELRLKNNEQQQQVDEAYQSHLVYLLNHYLKELYGAHQRDIEAEQQQWWVWTLLAQFKKTPEDRTATTQAIQLGLLHFVAEFHQHLAKEKTWRGEHPIRFSVYSGLVGGALGLAATMAIGALTALMWPVVAAAVVGGLVFGLSAYWYAKKAPFKRSFQERQRHQAFADLIDNENNKEQLKARLLQTHTLTTNEVQGFIRYTRDTEAGYFSRATVAALGTPQSWVRAVAQYYAHNKVVENDVIPRIKALSAQAEEQTTWLVTMIKAAARNNAVPEQLKRYVSQTQKYVLHANSRVQEASLRFRLMEKAKEQILHAVAQVGNKDLPQPLYILFKGLRGSDDELNLAKLFCPDTDKDAEYTPLLQKATQLHQAIPAGIFVGAADYWQALGSSAPQQMVITVDTIDSLLHHTTAFLQTLTPPLRRGSETSASYSEAFYLYRALLMRQLACFVNDKENDERCKQKIKAYIKEVLYANTADCSDESIEAMLDDAYYQDLYKPKPSTEEAVYHPDYPLASLANLRYVASAIRLDLAHHPMISPALRMQQFIADFVAANHRLVFGDVSPTTLVRLNFDTNAQALETINNIITDSQALYQALQEQNNPSNHSPIDLSYAYQELMTRQVLFTLKSLLLSLERATDVAKSVDLKKAFLALYRFLTASCCPLDDTQAAFVYLKKLAANQGDDIAWQEQLHQQQVFNVAEIKEGAIQVKLPAESALQRNIKLPKLATEDHGDYVYILYTPGAQHIPTIVDVSVTERRGLYTNLADYFYTLYYESGSYLLASSWASYLPRLVYAAPVDKLAALRQQFNAGQFEALGHSIQSTEDFLSTRAQNNDALSAYKHVQRLKSEVLALAASSTSVSLSADLITFFTNDLHGHEEHVQLAQHFGQDKLAQKAKELNDVMRKMEQGKKPLLGHAAYWRDLDIKGLDSAPINNESIEELLHNSRLFLQQLTPAIQWNEDKSSSFSDAFYLYRLLLLRELTTLLYQEGLNDKACHHIRQFIHHTLQFHPDLLMEELNQYDALAEASRGIPHVLGAMRLMLSHEAVVSPTRLLDGMLAAYITCQPVPSNVLLFGDTREGALQRFKPQENSAFSKDITACCEQTKALLNALKAHDKAPWNQAPVDLYPAYKHLVTEQAIAVLKAIIQTVADKKTSDARIDELKKVYQEVYNFWQENGLPLQDKGKKLKITLDLFNEIFKAPLYTLEECRQKARQYYNHIKDESTHRQEYVIKPIDETPDYIEVKTNLVAREAGQEGPRPASPSSLMRVIGFFSYQRSPVQAPTTPVFQPSTPSSESPSGL